MQFILSTPNLRTNKIVIPQNSTYQRALELTSAEQHRFFKPLGYIYDFQVKEDIRKDTFVLTNSDQIEALTELVEKLPDVTFRIAALTEMSPVLSSMVRYLTLFYTKILVKSESKNYWFSQVFIWILTTMARYKVLFVKAFEHQQIILGFSHTLHDRRYIAQENIFEQGKEADFVARIREIYQSVETYKEAVVQQITQSSSIEPAVFRARLQEEIGMQAE